MWRVRESTVRTLVDGEGDLFTLISIRFLIFKKISLRQRNELSANDIFIDYFTGKVFFLYINFEYKIVANWKRAYAIGERWKEIVWRPNV